LTRFSLERLNSKFFRSAILVVSFFGVFVGGLYAGNIPPFHQIFGANIPSSSTPAHAVSLLLVANVTYLVPANGIPLLLAGPISMSANRTVTVFITDSGTSCSSLYFNGFWKPDKSFPWIARLGLSNIVLTEQAVAVTAPVVGGQLFLYASNSASSSCSLNGAWLSVFLQP
jgi:hypothetical protein